MRDGIPIFFSSCGKENGHSWSKEKTLRDELTGKAVNSPKTGAGRHALPTKSGSRLPAALYPNIKSAYPRTCGCGAQRGSKTESAYFYSRAFRFATHYPVRFLLYPRLSSFVPLGVGFSCPVPRLREGFPKGRAPQRHAARFRGNARLAAYQGWDGAGRCPRAAVSAVGVASKAGAEAPAFVSLGV